MKKMLLTLLVAVATAGATYAQDRVIRMPEQPKKGLNIAEEDSKFWCAFETGGGCTLMEGMRNVAITGGSFSAGYRLNQYLKVGAGLGLVYYPNGEKVRDTKNHFAKALFVNARGNILSEDIRHTVPYWSVNAGATLPDGMFVTPSVGLRIGEKRNAFLVSIGYTLRHLKTPEGCKSDYEGALIKLGYEF